MAAAACSSSDVASPTTPPPAATPNGNYSITTVNGQGLPVALAHDSNYTYEVTNGTLSLTSDGKFSVVTTYRQTIPGNVSMFVDSTGGTWAQSGATVTLTNSSDGTTDTAAWAGLQMTFVETVNKVTTTSIYTKK